MEVKPFNIQICVAYPPDTDTPGYKEEMLTKPLITKKISESGSVFTPVQVAQNIVEDSEEGYYTISTGVDGWFLKQAHAGMTPMNNPTEVAQQIIFSGILRLVGVFYMTFWNYVVKSNMTATADGEDKKSTSENDKKKN
jgi:3-dehydrosphinganine reductase